MTNSWRPIPGFEGYLVSDRGEVKKARGDGLLYVSWGGRERLRYRFVRLYNGGKRRHVALHRVVYLAFVGPIPEGAHIDHVDGDPLNNELANLRAVTPSENQSRRGFRLGEYAEEQDDCPF